MEGVYKKPIPNPWEKANLVSKLFFFWVFPIFRKGFSTDLTLHDLDDSPTVHSSSQTAGLLEKAWENEKSRAKKSFNKPKLWRALVSVHKWSVVVYLVIISIDELFLRVVQPIYVRKLVQSFSNPGVSRNDKILFAAVVCGCAFLHDLAIQQCAYLMFRVGLSCRTATSALLYRKALRLKGDGARVGNILNMLSNDVSRFDFQLLFIPYILVGPVQFVILMYILYAEMGVSAFAGVGFIFIMFPTQVLNGHLAAKFRENVAKQTDERGRIMNEIALGIRVIKMYAWEKPFAAIIKRIRKNEVTELGKRAYLRGVFASLYIFSPRLTSFFVILTYVLLGNQLTADKAFFSVSISLVVVESMMLYFSQAVAGVGETGVSVNRIEEFLLQEEPNLAIVGNLGTDDKGSQSLDVPSPSVVAENVTTSWTNADKPCLKDVSFQVDGDKLVIIVGPVGSGKTSLLHLLISELSPVNGTCKISGDISYAAQEPWIFPASVRDNILFGEVFDAARYEYVVTACALKDDFKQLSHGDQTLIGERGINLSGGQKARINLARSLYRKADIYVMDDPLSAVDSRVSRHIFGKALKSLLKGKLRILVTHQIQYLPEADFVIVLNNGKVDACGTYQTMVDSGINFMNLVATEGTMEQSRRHSNTVEKTSGTVTEVTDILSDSNKPEEESEKSVKGSVGLDIYWAYLKSGKSQLLLLVTVLLFVCGQLLLSSCELWLSYWTNSEDNRNRTTSSARRIFDPEEYLGQDLYISVYAGLVGALLCFTILKALGFFGYCLRISNNLHNRMFNSVVRAPTKFFDENPSGRIMNRFTKDMGSIDELLPPSFYDTIEYALQMMGVVAVIVMSNYMLAIPTVVISVILWGLRTVYVRTSRDVKRLEAVWKGPMFTHVTASLQGLTTIRAFGAEDTLAKQFDQKQDLHSATWFTYISIVRCFATWSESVAILFLTVVTFTFVLFTEEASGGTVGLAVTSVLALSVNIQWAIRQSAETENHMTSVERALEYSKLPSEGELEKPDEKPPSDWPSAGQIDFENVFLSYEAKDVLKNLNFCVPAKAKIGIVGRTGAGKSSIITALFRMAEPKGTIYIDGVCINDIGLHDLRKAISIIPQDPVLFCGTMRYNLDPFNQFEDPELWEILERVQLKSTVTTLDHVVSDGGGNFSVGQRQLVCLARSILRKNKILVLDEATANIDLKTDDLIQKTIREVFADCTIITIAHRLNTVMDCDKIMVLEGGELKEYDHPYTLLQKTDGLLSSLARNTGSSSNEMLNKIARNNFHG